MYTVPQKFPGSWLNFLRPTLEKILWHKTWDSLEHVRLKRFLGSCDFCQRSMLFFTPSVHQDAGHRWTNSALSYEQMHLQKNTVWWKDAGRQRAYLPKKKKKTAHTAQNATRAGRTRGGQTEDDDDDDDHVAKREEGRDNNNITRHRQTETDLQPLEGPRPSSALCSIDSGCSLISDRQRSDGFFPLQLPRRSPDVLSRPSSLSRDSRLVTNEH